jgi:hypothetical protein
MIVALWLLGIQGVIGAFDTIYYHEWRARLPARGKLAASELKLHAARDFLWDSLSGARAASGARLGDRSRWTHGQDPGSARNALADPQWRMASVGLRAVCHERPDMVDSVLAVLA